MNVKLSVIMSVYNGGKYIREAIESILNQTFSNFEFIIVNDGSTDNSIQIIESYKDKRIIVKSQKNKGAASARNNAIRIARSDYIAILDSDDIALPTRLEKQYNYLKEHPDYILVGSNAIVIDQFGNYIYTTSQLFEDSKLKDILPNNPFYHSSTMFRKCIYTKAGEYPEYMPTGQDVVLFNKMAKYGMFANLSESLIKYRIVPDGISYRDKSIVKRRRRIINSSIIYNDISADDLNFLQSLSNNKNSNKRLFNYHLYLAKKYLWNNYEPHLARENIHSAIRYRNGFSINVVMFYLLSFFNSFSIKYIYRMYKFFTRRLIL